MLDKLSRYLRADNQFNDRDWDVLPHLESILSTFETVVRTLKDDGQFRQRGNGRLESYGNVWNVILGFEKLLGTLKEFKRLSTTFPNAEQFRIKVNLAWEKLDKYYNLLDETPIYYTALALHPAYRWDWFEKVWKNKPEWVNKAKTVVQEVWTKDYAHLCISSRGSDHDSPPAKKPRFYDPFKANRLMQFL
jgi:hypothetical protein